MLAAVLVRPTSSAGAQHRARAYAELIIVHLTVRWQLRRSVRWRGGRRGSRSVQSRARGPRRPIPATTCGPSRHGRAPHQRAPPRTRWESRAAASVGALRGPAGFERFGARAAYVERDAAVRVAGLEALVASERGGGVHRDAVPDVRDPVARHPVIEQQCPHEVGAAHLEPLGAISGRGQPDVVQHRAQVEHLVVQLDAVDGGERSRELIAALAVGGPSPARRTLTGIGPGRPVCADYQRAGFGEPRCARARLPASDRPRHRRWTVLFSRSAKPGVRDPKLPWMSKPAGRVEGGRCHEE